MASELTFNVYVNALIPASVAGFFILFVSARVAEPPAVYGFATTRAQH